MVAYDPCVEVVRTYAQLPPPGTPHGVPVPGSQRPGHSAVYRHWRIGAGDLLSTADPEVSQ